MSSHVHQKAVETHLHKMIPPAIWGHDSGTVQSAIGLPGPKTTTRDDCNQDIYCTGGSQISNSCYSIWGTFNLWPQLTSWLIKASIDIVYVYVYVVYAIAVTHERR